jgi:two-component system response regulator DesR
MEQLADGPDVSRRILVLDAHETVQCGLRFALVRQRLARRCLGCSSLPDAVAVTRRYEPNLAIVGHVPGAGQAHAIDLLRRARPGIQILALTDRSIPLPAADGRLPATASIREVLNAVQALDARSLTRGSESKSLSVRQREVLGGLAAGMTNGEIAECLGVSIDTVKWHVRALCRRLGARNRAQAVAMGDRVPVADLVSG